MKRIRITPSEADALLAVAGNADAWATFQDATETDEKALREIEVFERGMDKLRAIAARRPDRGGDA